MGGRIIDGPISASCFGRCWTWCKIYYDDGTSGWSPEDGLIFEKGTESKKKRRKTPR
ncbi:MAG: hypothetical protein AB1410_07840 [Acidobacteriota bacterium]